MELGGGAGGGKEGSGVCGSSRGGGDCQACPAQGGRGADLLILKFHTRCKIPFGGFVSSRVWR